MFDIRDGEAYFNGHSLGKIKMSHTTLSARRDWHADYLEEQKPPVKEVEPELCFTRISWFEDGRFKVKRVPVVHG